MRKKIIKKNRAGTDDGKKLYRRVALNPLPVMAPVVSGPLYFPAGQHFAATRKVGFSLAVTCRSINPAQVSIRVPDSGFSFAQAGVRHHPSAAEVKEKYCPKTQPQPEKRFLSEKRSQERLMGRCFPPFSIFKFTSVISWTHVFQRRVFQSPST